MTTANPKIHPTIDLYYNESTFKNDYSVFNAMERGDQKWDEIRFGVIPDSELPRFLKENVTGKSFINLYHSRNSQHKLKLLINYWDSRPYPQDYDPTLPPDTVLIILQLRKEL